MSTQGPFAHLWRDYRPRDLPNEQPVGPGELPAVFQFSQSSLQDYVDCPRRFQLRYVLGLHWPAAEQEPIEEREHFLERGEQFHLLVHRHQIGIPADRITPQDPLLRQWWQAYLDAPPPDLPVTVRLPEVQLSVPLGDQRLLARFDLLAVEPGQRLVIVDWKTTDKRPSHESLARRLQSRVYPFVAVEGARHLFGGPIEPEQVSLVYWFAQTPREPEVFRYSGPQHAKNRIFLLDLIREIRAGGEEEWAKTEDVQRCLYCVYRSLCDRGGQAGPVGGAEDEDTTFNLDFDLDTVEEIAF